MTTSVARIALVALCGVALQAGCGSGSDGPRRTVTGTCQMTHWLDDGTRISYASCQGTVLKTYARTADGAWSEFGSAEMTGTGYAVSAPAGKYLMGVKFPSYAYWEFFETDAGRFDLDEDWLGRPDALRATSSTAATFQLQGLDPWDADDYLELTSSDGATFAGLAYPGSGATVTGGATSADVSFDWYGTTSRLPDGARGDVVFLHQGATRPLAGTAASYQSAVRAARLPSTFAMADGQPTLQSVQLLDVPQTGRLTLDWPAPAFEAHRADIHPSAASLRHHLLVDATSHALAPLSYVRSGTPDLLMITFPPGAAEVQLKDLPYGQFLPAPWVEFLSVTYTATVRIMAPGASQAATLTASIARRDPLPLAIAEPVVTPPRAPRVGDADGFVSPSGVGTAPTLSWSPPALGAPTSYVICLYQAVPDGNGGTRLQKAGYLTAAGTSVRVPAGVLQGGASYAAMITAYVKHPETFDSVPFAQSYPEAWASAVVLFST